MKIIKLRCLLIIGSLGLNFLSIGQCLDLPQLTDESHPAYISGTLIYSLEHKPTPQCHASTIVETPSGMVSAWFGGTHEKHTDVGIWISRHIKGKWSNPSKIANGSEGEDKEYPCWNPVLFRTSSGKLMLFYKVGPSPSKWWGVVRNSDDDGKTWSSPSKLGKDSKIGHLIGPVKNKPVQLNDGTLISPSSTEHDRWKVHFEVSKDDGKTWKVIGPIHDGKEFGAIQPSILNYKDGRMQIMCRSRQSVISQSWSNDQGKTWTPMKAANLPNPNAGTDAVTLSNGTQLIVYNHTNRGGRFPSGRNMLNIAISNDGKDWKPVMTLEKSKGEYSYPAVIQTNDSMIHITYTYQRISIKHVVIDPSKLVEKGK
jgi:predicted neuraminidase